MFTSKVEEDKELISFLRYFPSRIKNIGMDAVFDRQIVYDYKDGTQPPGGGKCVAKFLVKKFGTVRYAMWYSRASLQVVGT